MSYSTVTYTGDGITQVFAVPFAYINQSDVQVRVGGLVATFIFLTSSTIQITPAPASGAQVYLFRSTGLASANVVFADGYTLRAADLNSVNTQVLYGLQEAWDQTALAISAAQAASGNLPSVTVAQNSDVLQVVGGVWTLTTPTAFFNNSSLNQPATKGDLWTFNATTTARLGIGANNTVLVADSTQATGNKWAFVPNADTSITSGASGIAVGLAASGGLQVSSGLLVRGFRVVSADPGSPTDGDTWYNSTGGYYAVRELGQTLFPSRKVTNSSADSTAITNTTTAAQAASVSVSFPANSLKVGTVIRVVFSVFVTASAVSTTLTPLLALNGSSLDGAGATVGVNSRQFVEFILTVRSIGSGGTIQVSGRSQSDSTAAVLGLSATTAINTTISNTLTPQLAWGATGSANSAVIKQFVVEKL